MATSGMPGNALTDGGHACCFYDTDEEHREYLVAFVRDAVAAGHKVVCVADAGSTRRILADHTRGGAGKAAVERGQLVVVGSEDAYLAGGFFDPDRMLDWWPQQMERAVADGYPGLRVTGDVTWYTRALPGAERLMEYEQAVGGVLADTAASALCQYDRRRLDDGILAEAVTHHRGGVMAEQPIQPQRFRVLGSARDGFRLVGELDLAGAPVLSEVLRTAVADGAEALSVDLENLQFLDAAGATALCASAGEHGVALELRRPSPTVNKVLSILEVHRLPTVRVRAAGR